MPGIVNRPSARETAAYVVPDGPCTATTRAPSTGVPAESVAMPAMAEVVTPWASAEPTTNIEKTAAATMARREPTIQRMDGPLLRGNECRVLVTIETGRKWSARGTPSRTLGGCFTQQIHGTSRDEKIGSPRRQHRRQDASGPDRFRQLKHQQHDECRGETRRDAPRRAALGGRDRERRAEQRDQQADKRNRDLERELDLQLLRVGAAARQRIDVLPQLPIAHFVRRLRLGEQIHRPLRERARLERIE